MIRRLFRIAIVLLIIAAAAGVWARSRLHAPFRGFTEPEVFVDLPSGTSVQGIASRLADAGVVPDALTFRIAARLAGDERHLQAGEYRFAEPLSPLDVVNRLARGDVYARPVTFREGLNIKETAEVFAAAEVGPAAEFERAARDAELIEVLDHDAPNLEGYLFPATYALPRRLGAREAVQQMVTHFTEVFDAGMRESAAAAGLTVRQAVTLASIVEKETAAPEERPIVAAVYRNRLRIGMPLQCDPTVIYAMIKAGRWHGNLTRQDLQMDSPYNTYRYPGLPPGPIASPGRASLDAAVHPAAVPYLYFVSRNDGTHVFA
ncbi:MAG: endolytic transglycosylase MltG, partial [Vicinamibacterales bacterium]